MTTTARMVHGRKLFERANQREENAGMIERWLVCDCGEECELAGFTNTCECGAEYNMSGALLAPREQWGEETGEHASDLNNLDDDATITY